VEIVAELKVIFFPFLAFYLKLKELFQDEVISKFINRQQALQTSVHVAVEGVILKTNYSILQLGHLLASCWTLLLLGSCFLTLSVTLRLGLSTWNLKAILLVFVGFKLREGEVVYDCGPASVDHVKEVKKVFIH
jgi:hypothetical protein